ncbi:MAG: hypothetical protein IPP71_19695 [Bacteroidetes bacterium]|nr:hypothetical protein [Bacteroidota bacterium]
MVYDSVLSSILISIPSTDPVNGNSIGFVNPALPVLQAWYLWVMNPTVGINR